MKKMILFSIGLTSPCWSQVKPVSVEVSKQIAVKLETPGQAAWQFIFQFAAAPVLVAISTLLAVWLTNRNNQQANERQHQREMLRWKADKQLEVLGRIGQLIVQSRLALRKREEEYEKGVRLREVQAPQIAVSATDEASRSASQELADRLAEFAALAGTARFILSDTLWRVLQRIEETFVDVSRNPRDGDRRTEHERELDARIEEFTAGGRREIDSLSGRT